MIRIHRRAVRPAGHRTAPGRRADDCGITLIEVMVSMTLMVTITSLFATSIVQAYQVGNKTESMAEVQSALHNTFSRLDRQIRYASSITDPGGTGADQYVEFLTANTGAVVCTQLHLDTATGSLRSRNWQQGQAIGGWSTLAAHVTDPSEFVRSLTAVGGATHQQLTVTLTVTAGKGRTATTQRGSVTFTALNTSLLTNSADTTCNSMGRS